MATRPEWERLTRRLMRLGVTVSLDVTGAGYGISLYCGDAPGLFEVLAFELREAERAGDTTRTLVVSAHSEASQRKLATLRLARRRLTTTGPMELAWVAELEVEPA